VTGPAVAGALTIAAVLAIAGVVSRLGGYTGASFGDRVQLAAIFSISAMGVVLAAAVALSYSDSSSAELAPGAHWRVWAYGSLGVIAVATAAASLWGMGDAFVQRSPGIPEPHLALARFELATAALAPALLALAAIVVILRARRRVPETDVGVAVDDSPRDVFVGDLFGPTVGCVLTAGMVLFATAVTSGFTHNSVSVADRIRAISISASSVTTAFIAFAVVVLVALGCRPRARDRDADPVVMIAGVVGLLVTVAAAYSVWVVVTASRSTNGSLTAYSQNWWLRLGEIGAALAAGTIGVVAASIARRLRTREPFEVAAELTDRAEPSPMAAPDQELESNPRVTALRSGARVVAASLAVSAAAYATFTVLTVYSVRDELGDPFKVSMSDVIALTAPYVLTVAGLALATAIVMTASRPDVTGRNALNDVVDSITALIAVAVVAVSGYTICSVLFGHHDGRFSLLAHYGTAQRISLVGTSVAAALVAAAAIHLVVRGRRLVADRETERQIEALDLLSAP
jgi:hypothetical protein